MPLTSLRGIAVLPLVLFALCGDALAAVTISTPRPGTALKGMVRFTAQAPGASRVQFAIGSLRLGSVAGPRFSILWNTAYVADGHYRLEATAFAPTGKTLGTTSTSFRVNNHGRDLNVISPNLSKSLSGTVQLTAVGSDDRYFPALWTFHIDGDSTVSAWTDHDYKLRNSVIAHIDTTRYSNGIHELYVGLFSDDRHDKWHDWRAGYDTLIDIQNGHKLMAVSPNYLYVYLHPGGGAALSCRDLFTDGTRSPCRAPRFSSDSTTVASVDSNGHLTAGHHEGFATITVRDQGRFAHTYVWVRASLGIPHFGSRGQILNNYTPGQSLFTISLFNTDIAQIRAHPSWAAALDRAGVNTLSQGIYANPRKTNEDFANWRSQYDSQYAELFNWAAAHRFHLLLAGDDITRSICGDAWYTLHWPSGRQAVQHAFESAASTGVALGVDMVDETSMFWGPNPYPHTDWVSASCTMPKTWFRTLRGWIRSAEPTLPISWPNLGIAPVQQWANWDGPHGVADYTSHYYDSHAVRHTYFWSAGILEKSYWMAKSFYERQPYMMLDRPQLMLRSVCGSFYEKNGSGAFYEPSDDLLIQPGDVGPVVTSGIMGAAALGTAGVRLYFWQSPSDDPQRLKTPRGAVLQTGVNPISADPTIALNWQAIQNAGSAIAILAPYLLAVPLNSPAYGPNILSAARQGAHGRMLLIVNGNDWTRTLTVDLAPFSYGGTDTRYYVSAYGNRKNELSYRTHDLVTLGPGDSVAYIFSRIKGGARSGPEYQQSQTPVHVSR
jgi:hypothetical protein